MAARSLGVLTLDLVVKTGGFEKGMDRAARESEKRMKQIEATAKKVGLAIGTAFVGAAAGLVAFVKSQAESIANYQDIAEKIGDTAEAVASLKAASDVSETSLDDVAAASIRLSSSLSKTDDEAKGVGKALAAIGLNLEDFKKLSPVEQLDAIAKGLNQFADGAGKSAVAVALLGKSGAQLLPFFNDLADGAERQNTLTQAQIEKANELVEAYAGLKGNIGTLSQQFAAELIPVGLDVVKVFADLLKEVKAVAGDNSVKEFAQGVVLAFAVAGEAVFGLIKALNAVRGSFQSVFADLKLFNAAASKLNPVSGAFNFISGKESESLKALLEERNRVAKEANDRYVDLFTYNGTKVSDALRKSFADQENYVEKVNELKPELKFNGVPPEAARNTKAATDAMKDYEFEVRKAVDAEDTERREERQDALNRKIADAASVFEATRTPLERFNAELKHLNELRNTFVDGKPLIDDVTYRRKVVALQDDLTGLSEKTEEVASEMSVFMDEAARNMQDALADFLFDPFDKGLKGMLQGFAQTLQRMAAEAAAAQIFKGLTAGASGSGGFLDFLLSFGGGLGGNGAPIGGPRAAGGPVSPGKAYLVGEEGPEWMIPSGAGTILPNGQGMTVNQSFVINAPQGSISKSTQMQIAAQAAKGAARGSQRNN